MKCKYCNKEGIASFGFLDRNGAWQDKHMTCSEHMSISFETQKHLASMEDWKLMMEQFGKNPPIVFSQGV